MRKTTLVATIVMASILFTSYSASATIISRNNKVAGLDEGVGNLKGFVNKWDGDIFPVEGAHVYIAGGHINITEFNISVALKEAITDAEGNYRIDSIPTGNYSVLVTRYGLGDPRSEKWIPVFRHTSIYEGQTTTENFLLKRLGRSRPLIKLYSIPCFQGLLLNLSLIHI